MTRRHSLRRAMLLSADRLGLVDALGRGRAPAATGEQSRGLNDLFARIVYLNLDRRPDRRAAMEAQAAALGLTLERFAAVDGRQLQAPAGSAGADYPAWRLALAAWRTDWLGDHALRVALLERESGPNLRSAGALGYLRSMAEVLRRAIDDGIDSLLVLDDDVLFHRDTHAIMARVAAELPEDWRILQLGSLYKPRRIRFYHAWSPHLLLVEGRMIGSHAVALRRPLFAEALALVEREDAAYDDGALTTLAARHWRRSFLTRPAVAIQSFADTDIQTPEGGLFHDPDRTKRGFGWQPGDYLDPDAVLPKGAK